MSNKLRITVDDEYNYQVLNSGLSLLGEMHALMTADREIRERMAQIASLMLKGEHVHVPVVERYDIHEMGAAVVQLVTTGGIKVDKDEA